MTWRTGRVRVGTGSLAAAAVAIALTPSCEPDEDRFECGIQVGENVSQCDGSNEVCICGGIRRCAEFSPKECPDTGYRYRFGSEECVDAEEYRDALVPEPGKPETALCPEVVQRPLPAQRCGEFRNDNEILSCTSPDETCVCASAGGRCARNVGSACPSGFRADDDCIALAVNDFVIEVAANERCPPMARPDACGTVDSSGRLRRCAEGLTCACDGDGGGCAREVPSTICESGQLYQREGFQQCAPSGVVLSEHGLCAGQAEPAPVLCGMTSAAGRLETCATGETCICDHSASSVTGSCARLEASCASGYELVHNGECLALSEEHATVPLLDGATRCARDAPPETQCGEDVMADCGSGNAGCLCRGAESRCVVTEDGCESGLAHAGTRRCVAIEAVGDVRGRGSCPGTGGEAGAGGAGGDGGEAGAGAMPSAMAGAQGGER